MATDAWGATIKLAARKPKIKDHTIHSFALAAQGTNRLLALLSKREHERVVGRMKRVSFDVGETLVEAGAATRYCYFPIHGLISTTALLDGDDLVEVGIAGAEGFVGTGLIAGNRYAAHRSFAQIKGEALRVSAKDFESICEDVPELKRRLLLYMHSMYEQASQFAACNRRHEAEPRLARWLLMVQDRIDSDELTLTQEFLAIMLGTGRPVVSQAASALQDRGILKYARGKIIVMDREGLMEAACSCYAKAKAFAEEAYA